MAETKWTPGPLEIGWGEWMPGDSLTIHCEGAMVAEVYGYGEFPCFDEADQEAVDEFNERQKADANRFAAVDDLYVACQAAYDELRRAGSADRWPVVHQLRDALAKARGEAVPRG